MISVRMLALEEALEAAHEAKRRFDFAVCKRHYLAGVRSEDHKHDLYEFILKTEKSLIEVIEQLEMCKRMDL